MAPLHHHRFDIVHIIICSPSIIKSDQTEPETRANYSITKAIWQDSRNLNNVGFRLGHYTKQRNFLPIHYPTVCRNNIIIQQNYTSRVFYDYPSHLTALTPSTHLPLTMSSHYSCFVHSLTHSAHNKFVSRAFRWDYGLAAGWMVGWLGCTINTELIGKTGTYYFTQRIRYPQ